MSLDNFEAKSKITFLRVMRRVTFALFPTLVYFPSLVFCLLDFFFTIIFFSVIGSYELTCSQMRARKKIPTQGICFIIVKRLLDFLLWSLAVSTMKDKAPDSIQIPMVAYM